MNTALLSPRLPLQLTPVALAAALLTIGACETAHAQVAKPAAEVLERVEVTGMRAISRSSVAVKRESEVIVDGLVSTEIGALPDLSVGETLDRIPGVAGSRFHGAIDEVSVRGLGPFLGYSTFNGRQLTNGSGDRTVAFQMFPSELMSSVLVYKTQQADFLEGGISGLVDLGTVKPLGYKGPTFALDYRKGFQPKGANVTGQDGQVDKVSLSAVKSWDTDMGKLGVAVGFARTDGAFPEDVYSASSSYQPCNSINTTPTALTGGLAGSNCTYTAGSANPFYFATNSYNWRQVPTSDMRDALIGVVQFKPSDRLEVNVDFQLSKRTSIEDRHEFSLTDGRRGIKPLDIAANGALLQWQGNSTLEVKNFERNRQEDYYGGGLKLDWRATDRLALSADLALSDSKRDQVDVGGRLRSSARYAYTVDQRFDIPTVTFATPVDVTAHSLFNASPQATRELIANTDRATALRLDGKYDLEWGSITQLSAGIRLASRQVTIDDNNSNVPTSIPTANIAAAQASCAVPFLQSDWGKGSGTNLTSWAEFDSRCIYTAFTGVRDAGPAADPRSASDVDTTEKTKAVYLMANFETKLEQLPVEGNFGVRVVQTDVTAKGYRPSFTAKVTNGVYVLTPVASSFDGVLIEDSFTDVLPSLNLSFGLRTDLKLRAGLSQSIARPSFESIGAGRSFVLDANGTSVPDAIAGVSGGNPRTKPMKALNADLALDWYASKDLSLFGAVYYKEFKAATASALIDEQFFINGQTYTVPVAQLTNSDKKARMLGIELSAQQALTDLPAPFNRLGYGVGLNYNNTDSEFADPTALNPAAPLANFTTPAGLNGSSRFAASLMGYYEHAGLSARLIYKKRTEWFKPSAGVVSNRYVGEARSLDMSVDYKWNANLMLRFQALNLTNKGTPTYRPVMGSYADHTLFGPSYFLGVKYTY